MSEPTTPPGQNRNDPDLVERIERVNLANILKKLKAGKTLSAQERNVVAGVPHPALAKAQKEIRKQKEASHTSERADFWGCSIRTMQIMKADGTPVDDPAGMIRWHSSLTRRAQGMLSPSFAKRLFEERAKLEGVVSVDASDSDKAEFGRTYKPGTNIDQDNLADIKREQAYYLFKMRKSRDRKDWAAEAESAKQFRLFSDVVNDCELRAKKLGRDIGDLVPRGTLEAVARFCAYHLLRCADGTVEEMISALTQAGCGIAPGQLREILFPLLATVDYLEPWLRAGEGDNPAAPADWLMAALRAGANDVFEERTAKPLTA